MLFSERFDESWQTRWFPFGLPEAYDSVIGEDPVLVLPGDGSYRDGLRTRESWRLDRGGTVELDFHLELNAPDAQRIRVCLEVSAPIRTPPRSFRDWDIEDSVCALWPREGAGRFDPARILLARHAEPRGFFRFDESRIPDGWTRLTLALRPDGTSELRLDEERVAAIESVLPLENREWRIAIEGMARGTTLYVRDLILREGG